MDTINNFDPQDKKIDHNGFGSFEQFSDLVLMYTKKSLGESYRKLSEYGSDKVLDLLCQVAYEEGTDVWTIWRSWMQRHLIPVMNLSRDPHKDMNAFTSRILDLLGYIFMALEIVELNKIEGYSEAWDRLRDMTIDVPAQTNNPVTHQDL